MKIFYTLMILALLVGVQSVIHGVALNGSVFCSVILAVSAIVYANYYVKKEEAETN